MELDEKNEIEFWRTGKNSSQKGGQSQPLK
jgi:hypothetical protein